MPIALGSQRKGLQCFLQQIYISHKSSRGYFRWRRPIECDTFPVLINAVYCFLSSIRDFMHKPSRELMGNATFTHLQQKKIKITQTNKTVFNEMKKNANFRGGIPLPRPSLVFGSVPSISTLI